jgi:hypothetical protein
MRNADPSNVAFLVHGAEMRVARTRAVNRALPKAYGIGICSVGEIGSVSEPNQSAPDSKKLPRQPSNGNGTRTVRDRLCQVIRRHQLDPNLVKSFATDFRGVKALHDATRDQVEINFVAHVADWAEKDRNPITNPAPRWLACGRYPISTFTTRSFVASGHDSEDNLITLCTGCHS